MSLRESFLRNENYSALVSHLLVSLMLACLGISLVQLVNRLAPDWQGSYLPVVIWVVALECMFTWRTTRSLGFTNPRWILIHVSELVALLAGLKLLIYLLRNPQQMFADIPSWQADFFPNFFTGEYLFAAIFVLVTWGLGVLFAFTLEQLEGDVTLLEGPPPVGGGEERYRAREQLADMILYIGAGIVLVSTMVRIDLEAVFGSRSPLHPSALNVMVYFVLGLALLSQAQFSVLRSEWSLERSQLSANLGKRWTGFGLVFLFLLATIALVLPTRYSLGLLAVIGVVLKLILVVFTALFSLLASLFVLFLSLLGITESVQSGAAPEPVLPPLQPQAAPAGPVAWVELFKSILFWTVFSGVLWFAVQQYLSQHQEIFARLLRFPLIAWMRQAWSSLRTWLRQVNKNLASAVRAGLKRLVPERHRGAVISALGFLNLRRLSPRQRVLFFYLALVRRGGEAGLGRQAQQTPFEYEQSLERALPEVQAEISALTGAFVEARYSQHTIDPDEASQAQGWWQRLRKALRRTRL